MAIDTGLRWIEFISDSVDRDGRRHFFVHWLQSWPSDPVRHLPVRIAGALWWPRAQVFRANPKGYRESGYRVGKPPWDRLPREKSVEQKLSNLEASL